HGIYWRDGCDSHVYSRYKLGLFDRPNAEDMNRVIPSGRGYIHQGRKTVADAGEDPGDERRERDALDEAQVGLFWAVKGEPGVDLSSPWLLG
ncbi:MAG: hypothetical protein U1E27_13925, partial [Kiritimatiellia bacterium]|nr:hypothetical protein [Kiritimatiellia bacterium]